MKDESTGYVNCNSCLHPLKSEDDMYLVKCTGNILCRLCFMKFKLTDVLRVVYSSGTIMQQDFVDYSMRISYVIYTFKYHSDRHGFCKYDIDLNSVLTDVLIPTEYINIATTSRLKGRYKYLKKHN